MFDVARYTSIEVRHIVERSFGPLDLHPLQSQPVHGFVMPDAYAAVRP
jgi:hypothetical protein